MAVPLGHMARVRRPVRLFAALWLACHLSMFASALGAVSTAGTCVCPLGADASCPMHHKPTGSQRPCAMTSAEPTALIATLDTLLGTAGPLPDKTPAVFVRLSVGIQAPSASDLVDQPLSPDPPPPRT